MRRFVPAFVGLLVLAAPARAAESDEWKLYLARHPEPGECHRLVKSGFTLAQDAEYAKALEALQGAEKSGCGAGDGLVLARVAFLNQFTGNTQGALAYYKLALPALDEQYPTSSARATASYNAGYLLEKSDRPGQALKAYRKALVADPGFHNARTSLRGLLVKLARQALDSGDAQPAADFAAQALEAQAEIDRALSGSDVKGRRTVLGLAMEAGIATGDTGGAAARLDELLTIADATAALGAATLWREAGDAARAQRCYERAAELAPEDVGALMALGELLESQGRAGDAALAYARAGERDPKNADIFYALGYARFTGGDHPAAISAFRKALEAEPGHEAAREALSQLGVK